MTGRQRVDFDSTRTHVHAISTIVLIVIATIVYGFHDDDSHIIPYTVLTSSLVLVMLVASTMMLDAHTETELLLCSIKRNSVLAGLLWLFYLLYGTIWLPMHRIEGTAARVISLVWVATGMWCTFRIQKDRPIHFAFVLTVQVLTLFFPTVDSVSQYLATWALIIRVLIFTFTYFTNLYTRLCVHSQCDAAYMVATSIWVLFVNKWMLPLVGLHWMVQLHSLSRCFSKRAQEKGSYTARDDEEQDPLIGSNDSQPPRGTRPSPNDGPTLTTRNPSPSPPSETPVAPRVLVRPPDAPAPLRPPRPRSGPRQFFTSSLGSVDLDRMRRAAAEVSPV